MINRSLPVLVALAVMAGAQDIEVVPRLVAGSVFQLEVTRSVDNSERPKSNFSLTRTVDVRVVSVNRTGAVLEWKPRPSILERLAALVDPSAAMGFQITGQVPFTMLLDPDGAVEGLEDESGLGRKLVVARDALLKKTVAELGPEERKRADDMLSKVLSPANLIELATRDAQIYLAANGVALEVGTSVEADLEQPNPFGGKPLPVKVGVRMASATPAAATVVITMTYDPDGFVGMLKAIIDEFAVKAPPEEMTASRFSLVEEGTFVFDRKLRLIRDVTYTRRTTFDKFSKVEKWAIRMLTEPKR